MFHFHLALALIAGNDRPHGREALQQALKLQPDFSDAQRELRALGQ